MKHTITVGKPIKKGDKVVGYKDVREVPANEGFRYNRNGFATLQPDAIAALPKNKAPKAAAAKKDDDQDLADYSFQELREIAKTYNVKGTSTAGLIEAIEEARAELAAAD